MAVQNDMQDLSIEDLTDGTYMDSERVFASPMYCDRIGVNAVFRYCVGAGAHLREMPAGSSFERRGGRLYITTPTPVLVDPEAPAQRYAAAAMTGCRVTVPVLSRIQDGYIRKCRFRFAGMSAGDYVVESLCAGGEWARITVPYGGYLCRSLCKRICKPLATSSLVYSACYDKNDRRMLEDRLDRLMAGEFGPVERFPVRRPDGSRSEDPWNALSYGMSYAGFHGDIDIEPLVRAGIFKAEDVERSDLCTGAFSHLAGFRVRVHTLGHCRLQDVVDGRLPDKAAGMCTDRLRGQAAAMNPAGTLSVDGVPYVMLVHVSTHALDKDAVARCAESVI